MVVRYCSWSSCKLACMESNTNNISSARLHGLDQRQHRSETFEAVDMCQGRTHLAVVAVCWFEAEPKRDCGS